jgi:two-component system chemotaxis response regulator CheY
MKLITDSAEHHFLTTLDSLKETPQGWAVYYFAHSKFTDHKGLISQPAAIEKAISAQREKSKIFADELLRATSSLEKGYIYLFTDNDVVMVAHAGKPEQQELAQKIYWEMAKPLPAGFTEMGMLAGGFYNHQKLADHKFLSAKRFEAYHAMTDEHKVTSIFLRRERRDDPKVMIIEDDRFTAAYTANILGHKYDLVIARNGEEGIISYIEHAPDVVFLDIHLPGLNGLETLQAIRAVDPKAYVVMLSVDSAKDSIVQSTANGASKFLKKPFSKQRLLTVVEGSPYVRGSYVTPPEAAVTVPADGGDASAH